MKSRSSLEELAFGKIADQAEIGCEEIVLGKVADIDPAHLIEDVVLDFACEFADGKKLQVDGTAVTVIMADAGNGRADNGLNAQLFVKFASERLLRSLTGLNLAAWEFPFEGHDLVGAALADEDLIFANDESCGYEAESWTGLVGLRGTLGGVHIRSVNLL